MQVECTPRSRRMAADDTCVELPLSLLTFGAVASMLQLPSNSEVASVVPYAVNYTARNQVLTFGTVPVFDRVLDHSVASTEPLSWHCKISGPAPDALLWVRESEWLKVQAVLERHNVAAQALRAFRCPTLDAYEQTLVDRTLERTSPTSQDAAETAARQMARTRIDEARVVAAQTNISDPATKRCAIS
jgi:hypothetical protein